MIQPKLELAFNGDIARTDATGFWSLDNPGGWGSPNLERSAVTSALLKVSYNGQSMEEVNVTGTVQAALTETIDLGETPYVGDGVYKLFYELNGEIYQYGAQLFIHEQVKAELSQLWAYLATLTDNHQYRHLASELVWIDSHERQMNTYMRRGSEKLYLTTLKIVQDRIKINQINKEL